MLNNSEGGQCIVAGICLLRPLLRCACLMSCRLMASAALESPGPAQLLASPAWSGSSSPEKLQLFAAKLILVPHESWQSVAVISS